MIGNLDLFDAPVLPGIVSAAEIVGEYEESALIANINRASLSPFQFHMWTAPSCKGLAESPIKFFASICPAF